MGKKDEPKAPKAPDPYAVADAQSGMNRDAIIESARLNRYDQTNPYGSVTWNRTDPNDPSTWTQNTQLSPELQGQMDNRLALDTQLSGQSMDRLNYYDQPFKLQNLNSVSTGLDTSQLPQTQSGVNTGGMPALTSSIDLSGLPQRQTSVGAPSNYTTGVNSSPSQRTLNTADNPMLSSSVNRSNLPELSTDFSGDAQRMEDATYQRAMDLMNPEYDRQKSALESRLAVQGIPLGSEAYNDEMNRFQKNRDEASLAAALDSVAAGRAEHSRMNDINRATRGQLYGEEFNDTNIGNAANSQAFNQDLASADMYNRGSAQDFSQDLTNANLNNQVLSNQFNENLTNANLTNQARREALAEEMSNASLASGARSQMFNEGAQNVGFNNAARQQGANEQLQNYNMAMGARQQNIGEQQLERNQGMNELAVLMGNSSGMPQMQTPETAQYQVAPPDYMGAQQLKYQGDMNNYNQQMASNSAKKGGTTGMLGTLGGEAIKKWG